MKTEGTRTTPDLLHGLLDRLVREEGNPLENGTPSMELALPVVNFFDRDYPDDDVFGVPSCCFDN